MDETMRILKMVEEGKITADEAARLIEALKKYDSATTTNPIANIIKTKRERREKIFKISIIGSDGETVNFQFPVKLVKGMIDMAGKLPVDFTAEMLGGMAMKELLSTISDFLEKDKIGDIIIIDAVGGDKIRIYVE